MNLISNTNTLSHGSWGNCVSSGTCPSGQWTLKAVALGLWHRIKQANWHLNTLELWSSTYLRIKGPPPDSSKLRTATLLEFPLPHILHRHKTRQASHVVSMSLSVGFLSILSSQRALSPVVGRRGNLSVAHSHREQSRASLRLSSHLMDKY